jgi:histidinol-phosphate/aromatic aminotransferase/cobyric acid decarboxylase-like protein
MTPVAREYRRADGTTFIVARTVSGKYGIVGGRAGFTTRKAAVAAGMVGPSASAASSFSDQAQRWAIVDRFPHDDG